MIVRVTYLESKTGKAEFFIDKKKYGALKDLENIEIAMSEGNHHLEVILRNRILLSERIATRKGDEIELIPDEIEKNRIRIKETQQ